MATRHPPAVPRLATTPPVSGAWSLGVAAPGQPAFFPLADAEPAESPL